MERVTKHSYFYGDLTERTLQAYEDTGLTPEEINKIVSKAPAKVSFDIGDDGFLLAINLAFKERYGVTADEFEGIIAERDTLKNALELACDALDYTPSGHTLMDLYIQQAQEQEGDHE